MMADVSERERLGEEGDSVESGANEVPEDSQVELDDNGSASWVIETDEVEWHVTVGMLEGYEPVIPKQREWLKERRERTDEPPDR